LLIGHTTLRAC